MNTARQRPFAVSEAEYPFSSHWIEPEGVAMHYLDEGSGIPVLMLHGNPTWSYLYRHLIKQLSETCRCIAPDYPGFGFSEHPPDYGYTPQEHAEWVAGLIDILQLDRFVLVVQDWGGPIGLSIAVERPEMIAGMVILNTWCWPPDWHLWSFSCVMGGPVGRLLQLYGNFFARRMVPWGIGHKDRKTPDVLKAYTDPFPTPRSRMGTYVFPRAIRKSSAWFRSVEERLPCLRRKPVEMVWAMKDSAFGKERYIRRWLSYFPDAVVDRVDNASHYLQEDCPERVAAAAGRVLARATTAGD
jgi:haloalkane dehalogenase